MDVEPVLPEVLFCPYGRRWRAGEVRRCEFVHCTGRKGALMSVLLGENMGQSCGD
jgi:hypothetical protein